jgi:hypothetical protein
VTAPLFAQLLGASYPELPPRVRELHDFVQVATWRGHAQITRGRGRLARLAAAIAGLPPAARDIPTRVVFERMPAGETWSRDFGGYPMRSRLWSGTPLLCERLGPIEFGFLLSVRAAQLHWQVGRVRLLGLLPLPAAWFRGVRCREREHAGRYEFLVEAAMPLLGPLIRYEGWLEPA